MKPVSFDYQRPNNICESLELLNEDHDARILAVVNHNTDALNALVSAFNVN